MSSARAVANEFISLASSERRTLTPMAIIKLVYIAHGWSLALYGRPLIEEDVEAWQYGPVVPDLYQAMKSYGSGPVTAPLPRSVFWGGRDQIDDWAKPLIKRVFELYGGLSAVQLSALTHQPDTPWSETYDRSRRNAVISDDLITKHYKRLAHEREPVAA